MSSTKEGAACPLQRRLQLILYKLQNICCLFGGGVLLCDFYPSLKKAVAVPTWVVNNSNKVCYDLVCVVYKVCYDLVCVVYKVCYDLVCVVYEVCYGLVCVVYNMKNKQVRKKCVIVLVSRKL